MKFVNITKKFDDELVFENFNLEISENKVTAIMGASGVGKSTLGRIMVGLTEYDGSVEMNGKVGAVFGDPALLPNLTVEGNLEYAIKHKIKDKATRKRAIVDVLKTVELSDDAKKFPSELSTGMAQRVALARAFVYPSEYILLDEPFRGLDVGVKQRLIDYLKILLKNEERTTIIITHQADEAFSLADELIVLSGRPAEVSLRAHVQMQNREEILRNINSILAESKID